MVRQLSGSAKRPTYEYSEVIRRRQRGLGHRPVHELQLLQKPVHACVPVSEAHRAPADGKGWPVREQKICLPWGGRLLLASTDEGGKERGGGGWGRDQHGPGKERPRLNGSVRNLVDDEQLLCLVCCPPRSYSYRSYAWLRRRLGRFKRLPTQEVGMTGSYWPGSHAHALEMLLSGWPLPLRKVRNFWVASAGEAMLHLDLSQGCFGESSPPMPLLIQVHSSAAMLAWLSLLREVKEQHNLSAVVRSRGHFAPSRSSFQLHGSDASRAPDRTYLRFCPVTRVRSMCRVVPVLWSTAWKGVPRCATVRSCTLR